MNICDPRAVRGLLEKYGVAPSKSLGQNFLVDPAIPEKIAEAADVADRRVIEIGPGLGALTRAICARAASVTAVELDRGLIPALGETLADLENVRVVQGDAMKADFPALCREMGEGPYAAAGNLPYQITTELVLRLLSEGTLFESVTVMVQREAAERLTAKPGAERYCAAACVARYLAEGRILFDVPAAGFVPAPTVTSSVVRFVPRGPVGMQEKRVISVINACFRQRRKKLSSTLPSAFPLKEKSEVAAAVCAAGIDPGARPEELSGGDFERIVKNLA